MDGIWVLLLQADEVYHRLAVWFFVERSEELVFFQGTDNWVPLLVRMSLAGISQIQKQLEMDACNPGVVCRSLDVATHPIEGISNATQHNGEWSNGVMELSL